LQKAIFIPFQKKLLKIEEYDGQSPSYHFWKDVPMWIRNILIVIAVPTVLGYLFITALIVLLFYGKSRCLKYFEGFVDKLGKHPFITPRPDIRPGMYFSKKMGYKIVIYYSKKERIQNVLSRNKGKQSSQFNHIIKADDAEEIKEFAFQNDIDLEKSIFIPASQNVFDMGVGNPFRLLESTGV